jgi:hypothetical protein
MGAAHRVAARSVLDETEHGGRLGGGEDKSKAGAGDKLMVATACFFQWIEGPEAEVRKLMASLHSDPRHYDIVPLEESVQKRERLYANWQMERVSADDILEVLQDALESAEDENNIPTLKRIVDHLATGSLDSLGRAH